MSTELETALARLRGRWSVGGSGLELAPEAWRARLGAGDSAELGALALAGQALQVCFRPAPAGELTVQEDLPGLAPPTLPESLRPLFRRALAALRAERSSSIPLVWLTHERGFVAHPLDWLPARGDALPSAYAPWLDWLAREGGGAGGEATLTAETWDDWRPSARLDRLRALRREDPEAARALVAAKAPGAPPERRLDLIGVLGVELSEADASVLEGFGEDRSGKVRARAQVLLARLGRSSAVPEEAQELADFLEEWPRARELRARKLKTRTQRARRRELFARVPLSALADALGLSPDALIADLRLDVPDPAIAEELLGAVAETGSDAAASALAGRITAARIPLSPAWGPLLDRLPAAARAARLAEAVRRDEDAEHALPQLLGPAAGRIPAPDLIGSPATRRLLSSIGSEALDHRVGPALAALGLAGTPEAARALVDACVRAGLPELDPRLAVARFDAALSHQEPNTP